MKLLFSANSFYPAVGGYERVAFLLAQQIAKQGHSVKVITFTPGQDDTDLPFEVFRGPGLGKILNLIRWADIYIQHNVSLRLLWPIILCWRPVVCIHHGLYGSSEARTFSWRYHLKHLITLFCTNISVSKAVSDTLPGKSHVIPNPYVDDVFFRLPNIARNRDLLFVGRIVSDKGVDVLLDAMAKLRERGLQPSLTVVGSGPEEKALRARVQQLRLNHLVKFVGLVTGDKLNNLLNAHRIMVIPTRIAEGFGVVALEGIACGCVVVGSCYGGLPEAIGPCGKTFVGGKSSSLAEVLDDLLRHSELWNRFFSAANGHLEAHRPSIVAERYIEIFKNVLNANR